MGIIDLELDDFTTELDKYLYNAAKSTLLHKQNHDFFYGAFGIFLYFLEDSDKNKERLESLFIVLLNTVKQTEEFAYWVQKIDKEKNAPLYNLGMAHGYPSYIMLLSYFREKNIGNQEEVVSLVKKTINFLLKFQLSNEDMFFPSTTTQDEAAETVNTYGWSYGDLPRATALIYAGRTFENPEWLELGNKIAKFSATRFIVSSEKLPLAGLCRGSAGVAVLFRRLFYLTKDDIFRRCELIALNNTIAIAQFTDGLGGFKDYDPYQKEWINTYDLLDVVSGIGLALLSHISDDEPTWDRCLLLS